MTVDMHSHILPHMDDGSRSLEESVGMLRISAEQGVGVMAATPHFYPAETDITDFLERRKKAEAELKTVWEAGFPRLLPGAEVYYFEGISRAQEISALCIGDTRLLLLEMPFEEWNGRMAEEVTRLQSRPDINVVLAHIERYLNFSGNQDILEQLLYAGVKMQCNASFFLHWRTRRKAMRMLRQGMVHMLGSDCHNLSSRPPRLGEAFRKIGREGRGILRKNMKALLEGM